MVYHLRYDCKVAYFDLPMGFDKISAEVDLSQLDWVPSEMSLGSELIQLALRGARVWDRGCISRSTTGLRVFNSMG